MQLMPDYLADTVETLSREGQIETIVEAPADGSALAIMLASGPLRSPEPPEPCRQLPQPMLAPIAGDPDLADSDLAFRLIAMIGFAEFCICHQFINPSEYKEFPGLRNPLDLMIHQYLPAARSGAGTTAQVAARSIIASGLASMSDIARKYEHLIDAEYHTEWKQFATATLAQARALTGAMDYSQPYNLIAQIPAQDFLDMNYQRRMSQVQRSPNFPIPASVGFNETKWQQENAVAAEPVKVSEPSKKLPPPPPVVTASPDAPARDYHKFP